MSDRLKYLLNGVYKCENFAHCAINDNFEIFCIGKSLWNVWFMKLAPKIISGRLVVHPCLSCENETVFRLRAYFNILKKDGSSGCKIAFNSLYLSDNETIEAYMDVEALLDEKNGFLDDGSLTVEYGLQFESQKYDEDGIWRFNLSDVFYDWKNQDNMFIFLIDYDTDKIPVFAHRQIVKLHSKKIFDFNENWVRGPNDNSLDDYDVNDCLQITHGVKLTSIFDISKIARIASHYGFCNTIRYCEQQLIETDEQPKVTIQNFKLAIECGMKCYLIHLLIHVKTKKRLVKLLRRVELEKMSSESMKACAAKLLS